MSDWFLKKSWQDIRDSSWPDIEYWDDFLRLDDRIKLECNEQHAFQDWIDHLHGDDFSDLNVHQKFYQKDQFVFVNVGKCGSMHHEDFFVHRLGWTQRTLRELKVPLYENYVFFGLMMHPLRRYLKGVTEYIFAQNISHCVDFDYFMEYTICPDLHSMPYSMIVRPELDRIHWIPLSGMPPQEVKQCMNRLFKYYGSDLCIPTEHPPLHESGPEQLNIFHQVKAAWEKQGTAMYYVYKMHKGDIKFYHDLIERFQPDWSHLADNCLSNIRPNTG
jgi:hypothetical protein